jgi:hypothetical protein
LLLFEQKKKSPVTLQHLLKPHYLPAMAPGPMTPSSMTGKTDISGGSPKTGSGNFSGRSSYNNWGGWGSVDGGAVSADSNGATSGGDGADAMSKSETVSDTKSKTVSYTESKTVSYTESKTDSGSGNDGASHRGGDDSSMSQSYSQTTQAQSQTVANGTDGSMTGYDSGRTRDYGTGSVDAGGGGAGNGGQRGDSNDDLAKKLFQ